MVPEMAPFGVFSCVSLEGLRPAGSDDDQRKKKWDGFPSHPISPIQVFPLRARPSASEHVQCCVSA